MQLVRNRSAWLRILGITAALAMPHVAHSSPVYSVTDLRPVGTIAGSSLSTFLNNQGQVVGTANLGPSTWFPGGDFPFLYDPNAGGKVTYLGITPPSDGRTGSLDWQGTAYGLNDDGQVLGTTQAGKPFLYDNRTGQTTNPGIPAGFLSNAGQLANSGRIAGASDTLVAGSNGFFYLGSFQDGTLTNLGTIPLTSHARVRGVNDAGQFLVNADGPGTEKSYLFDGGKWTGLGPVVGWTLNARGDVAGWSPVTPGGNAHAAVIPLGGEATDLGTLPGGTSSAAYGINRQGDVVGTSFGGGSSADYRGFLYQNGEMTDLNSLLAAGSGWLIRFGIAINDKGQILALADNSTSSGHILLLTPDGLPTPPDPVIPPRPVPEPTSLVVLGVLAAGLLWRTRREKGTLGLWCLSINDPRRWKLEFNVRETTGD